MTSLVDAVLCAVGIPILSYLELTDIVNNVTYTNKFLEVIAEQLCKQRLQSLNYFWIAADQIDFDCPVRRRGHFKRLLTLVTRKGAIIVGGNLDSRRCKFFSPKTRRFSTMNYMNVKGDTTNSTAVWHRGRIFVFSCNFESSLGSLEIYNPVLETWSKGAQGLPMIIKSSAAASCENALYVLGGDNYCKPQWKKSDRIFLLSNEENEQQFHWIKLSASLLRGRMFHAAVSYKKKIWIAGGLLEKRTGDAYNDLCTR